MIDTSPLNQRVEDVLKKEIVMGAFTPGQKIDIDEVGARCGVSVTPVRDAIRRLETIGLVTVAPRRGVYVATADYQKFKDVFELRIALEGLALSSATVAIPEEELDSISDRFEAAVNVRGATGDHRPLDEIDQPIHDLILQHCNNRKLVEVMDGLGDLVRWMRNIIAQDASSFDTAAVEHRRILHALQAQNVDEAQEAMRLHLEHSLARSRPFWGKNPAASGVSLGPARTLP